MTETSTEHSNHSGPLNKEQLHTYNRIRNARSEFAGNLLMEKNINTDVCNRLKTIQDQNRLV